MRFRPALLVGLAGVAVTSVPVPLPRPLKLPFTFKGHTEIVRSVAISSDGKRIVSGSASFDQTVRVWDAGLRREPERTHHMEDERYWPDLPAVARTKAR